MDLSQPLTLTNLRCVKCDASIAPYFYVGQESTLYICHCGHAETFSRPFSKPDNLMKIRCGHCNRLQWQKENTGTWTCADCGQINGGAEWGAGTGVNAKKEQEYSAEKRQEYSAESLLTHASLLVSGSRAAQHGPKERNHQNIADHWNAYLTGRLNSPLSPFDVALMMAELKIARAKGSIQMSLAPNPDNFVDLAGYAGIAGEIALNGGKDKK